MLIIISVFVNLVFLVTLLAFQVDLGAFFGVQTNPTTISLLKDLVMPISTAFFGAALGAYLAYKFSIRQMLKIESKKDHSILLNSFYVMSAQINELLDYKVCILKPNYNEKLRATAIMWCLDSGIMKELVNSEVGYVLAKYKELPVYKAMAKGQNSYQKSISLIQRRNELYDSYRTSLDKKVKMGNNIGIHLIVEHFGYNNLCRLYDTTEQMIESVDETIINLNKSLDCIAQTMNKHFPDDEYTNLESFTKSGYEDIFERCPKPMICNLQELMKIMDSNIR